MVGRKQMECGAQSCVVPRSTHRCELSALSPSPLWEGMRIPSVRGEAFILVVKGQGQVAWLHSHALLHRFQIESAHVSTATGL